MSTSLDRIAIFVESGMGGFGDAHSKKDRGYRVKICNRSSGFRVESQGT